MVSGTNTGYILKQQLCVEMDSQGEINKGLFRGRKRG